MQIETLSVDMQKSIVVHFSDDYVPKVLTATRQSRRPRATPTATLLPEAP